MKNTVMPDLDMETIERLKQRFPDLSNIELPKMEAVGKTADATIDRLMGRSKSPMWPWVAVAFGVAAVIGTIAAYLTWFRRPAMELLDDSMAGSLATDSTTESLDGTDPYRSTIDQAWPTESTSEVTIGSQEA